MKKPVLTKSDFVRRCEFCGKQFIADKKSRKFCSYSCSNTFIARARKSKPKERLKRAISRFYQKISKQNLCWIWEGKMSGNYGSFFSNGVRYYAHRFSYMINIDDMWSKGRANPPQGHVVGIAAIAQENPELVTGEGNGNSKLTEKDIRAIRKKYCKWSDRKSNAQQLAEEFGVCSNLISQIARRKRWSHVK